MVTPITDISVPVLAEDLSKYNLLSKQIDISVDKAEAAFEEMLRRIEKEAKK